MDIKIRNINSSGSLLRLLSGIFLLIICFFIKYFNSFIDNNILEFIIYFFLTIGGVLSILESKNKVCIYHSMMGTKETSKGYIKEDNKIIKKNCMKISFKIIIQSFILSIITTFLLVKF